MPLQPGQVLHNRYRIVKLLGQGGFGAVYRAWDANLSRPCAVKENLDTSTEAQRQFTREATVLANLSHSNLPRVTDHFILAGQGQYLVMDFVEGEDLASLIQRQGAAPVEQALVWVSQVADALTYLHSRPTPVVHRDIKPSNIRITPEGRAMLVDFGLVKLYDPSMRTTLGARAVTPGYAPPEQYGHGSTDSRTDIYALGATVYNLLTGQEPLESVQRMVGRHMPLANQVNPRVPPNIGAAIDRAMKLEPTQRYQTAAEFYNALTTQGQPVVVKPAADAYVRPLAPRSAGAAIPGTQVVRSPEQLSRDQREQQRPPAGRVYPAPSGARPATSGSSTAARSERKSGRSTAAWVGIAVFILLCLGGAFLAGAWIIGEGQISAQKTADHQVAETTTAARVRSTQTAQSQAIAATQTQRAIDARATATAGVYSTATARVFATETSVQATLETIEPNKALIFGPSSGSLKHDPDDTHIKAEQADVDVRDFIVEARFYNPFSAQSGDWDYGWILRHEAANTQYRFVVRSDGKWVLTNHNGDADGTIIAESDLTNLDLSEGGSNLIKLILRGERGFVFVNGIYITEIDVSARMNAGSILIGTGFYSGDEIAGSTTNYENFSIWSIP